jgi:tetratricopeptide (TPR) repeat protein
MRNVNRSRFVVLTCKVACACILCGLAVLGEESACPHSSPAVKAALDNARKNAEQIDDKYVRSESLHEVAKGYARNGDFEPALQVIRVDSRLMWEAADNLARNMLRCGEVSEVKAAAPTLDGRSRSLMLQWLAEWQAKHDDANGSQESLAQIKDGDIRREAQFNIVTARAIKGDAKTADAEYRKLLNASPSGTQSNDDLVSQDMALVYVMKGDINAAIVSLDKMKSGEKIYALYSVTQILAEKKDKAGADLLSKEALRITRPFLKDTNQAYPISLLATAQAKLGMFDDAIDLANSIPDEQRKDEALVMIAVHLIAVKNESRANAVLESLPKVPQGKADLEAEREMAWVRIAMAQANAGDGEDALKTLEKARDPRMDSLVKWQRAYAQARVGKFVEAQALAAQIPEQFPRDERGRAFRLVAAVNAHQKGESAATSWAAQLATPQDRTSAYLGIADGLLDDPTQEIPPYFQD